MSDFIKTDVKPPENGDLKEWVTTQLKTHGPTLLAFADDGVIWGRLWKESLATTGPELNLDTLQQAYIFGEKSEVRLFRDESNVWKALRVVDGDDETRVIKESQILWGNESEAQSKDGFLTVREYRAGIPGQILPLDTPLGEGQCARLEVHHLVEYDNKTGEARIALSRLAGLSIGSLEVKK